MALIDYDFRLLELEIELSRLEEYFNLLDKHMQEQEMEEDKKFDESTKQLNISGNPMEDPEYNLASQIYTYQVECILPRFYYNTFVVTLYSVFEAGITEIADLIKKEKKCKLSINDIRGDFLERAKMYFNDVISFRLCDKENDWANFKRLLEIRNAIAYTNGRIDMLREKSKTRISQFEKEKIGIEEYMSVLVVKREFVLSMNVNVKDFLNDLIKRYKAWDDSLKGKK